MGAEITNTAIPGDTTPQPNYMRLQVRERDLVDRAIYATLIQGNDFSPATIKQMQAGNFLNPQADRPRTDQVEQEIERLRENFSKRLLSHDTGFHAQITQAASAAPAAEEARRALNTIIALNGDECGCNFNAPPVTQADMNHIIHPRPTGHSR